MLKTCGNPLGLTGSLMDPINVYFKVAILIVWKSYTFKLVLSCLPLNKSRYLVEVLTVIWFIESSIFLSSNID